MLLENGGGRIFVLFPVQEEYLMSDKWFSKDVAFKREPKNRMAGVIMADWDN